MARDGYVSVWQCDTPLEDLEPWTGTAVERGEEDVEEEESEKGKSRKSLKLVSEPGKFIFVSVFTVLLPFSNL